MIAVRRADSGQSMVEFAFCLPVLMLIALGLCTFGIAMSNYIAITQATAVGVHQAAIDRLGTIDPCTAASSAVFRTLPTLIKSQLSFSLALNGTTYSGTSCTGATANMTQGQPATLTVTYPCSLWSYQYRVASCTLTGKAQELIQ